MTDKIRKDIIRIEKLNVHYQNLHAVKNISLEVKEGEILCLAGESGSGKTSVLNAVLGRPELRISGESISFDGRETLGISARERAALFGTKIGLVAQNPMSAFNPIRSYEKQIKESLKSHGMDYDREETVSCFAMLGLKDTDRILKSCPYEMSGGMRQRIAIAAAMLLKPRLLLCDEATSALDATTQKQVVEALLKLRDETGVAIIFVTHNMGVVAGIADRVGIMHRGELVEYSDKKSILDNPQAEYTKTLLFAVPRLNREGGSNGSDALNCSLCSEYVNGEKNRESGRLRSASGLLAVRELHKTYKRGGLKETAIEDISMSTDSAEIVGIVGESGSGKSTLLRQIACLEKPDRGEILLEERSIAGSKPSKICGSIQMVFQDAQGSFDPRLTIRASLSETVHHYDDSIDIDNYLPVLLKEVELDAALLDRYPSQLSGGQCQRMAIARAVISEPKLLLCDEATSSLDVSTQAQIVALLCHLRDRHGIGIIFVSHDLALVSGFCDRLMVLKDGRVVEEGRTVEIICSPKEDYTRSLLDSVML